MDVTGIIQRTWPGWRVAGELGTGSRGSVYRIEREDIIGQTQAAVKAVVIPQDISELDGLRVQGLDDRAISEYLEKVVRSLGEEIRLMETVKGYTNIVSIEDYHVISLPETSQWIVLIRMELLTPLLEHVQKRPLSEAEVIRLGLDLSSALVLCRSRNIVHRDIKPANIFINRDGDFKLGDFGVARTLMRMETQFTRVGTFDYMAPEIFNNQVGATDVDSAAKVDIYSLGLVMYAQLNDGRLPFVTTDDLLRPNARYAAMMTRMQGVPLPEPRHGSPALKAIVLRACAFDPSQRYQSAETMRQALAGLQGSVPERARNPKKPKRQRRAARPERQRRRLGSGALLKFVIIAIVALIALLSGLLIASAPEAAPAPAAAHGSPPQGGQ